MNNLRILLYVVVLSLAACHPEGTNVKQGLDKAAQLMGQDPDTASIILENIQINQMNEAQLAEYNLLCTQLNEDKNIAHTSDKQIRQAVSYFDQGVQTLQPLLSEIWSFRRSIGNGKKSLCQPANAERSDRRYEDYSFFCIGSLWCDVLITRAALEEE